jgi:hypothetical protein
MVSAREQKKRSHYFLTACCEVAAKASFPFFSITLSFFTLSSFSVSHSLTYLLVVNIFMFITFNGVEISKKLISFNWLNICDSDSIKVKVMLEISYKLHITNLLWLIFYSFVKETIRQQKVSASNISFVNPDFCCVHVTTNMKQ